MNHKESEPAATQPPGLPGSRDAEVLVELAHIQSSSAFCNSARSKEFLSYVVEQALANQTESLKERSIGVNLFHRPPAYDTGEDPIVRVKAGEVRRRLAEYYAAEKRAPDLQIELPVGSYIPRFRWRPPAVAVPSPEKTVVVEQTAPLPKRSAWRIALAATVLVVLGVTAAIAIRNAAHQKSAFDEFWSPAAIAGQPILICVSSPIGYAFSSEEYAQAIQAHPGLYDSPAKRNITPLQLAPGASVKWKNVTPLTDYFVNKDDAYVAAQLSGLFARIHKSSQARFGSDFTFEDLRNSPAVLIGAFDNPWTVRIISDFPIVFREDGNEQWIEDRTKPNQAWHPGVEGRNAKMDFAIVARLQNSKTGQFMVVLGGIGMVGTQAAGRFVSREADLDAALRTAPAGWQSKNIEMVLESDVIDGAASAPEVVAMKVW